MSESPGGDQPADKEVWDGESDASDGEEMTMEELLETEEIQTVMAGSATPGGEQGSTATEADSDPTDGAGDPTPEHEDKEWCQETVDQQTRQDVLRRDGHRCRFCGDPGPGAGGQRTLEVHHIDRAPEHCGLHDLDNLITICENCHSWLHKRPTADDVPVELSEADREPLLPYDLQILRILAMREPATIDEINDHLYPEHSKDAVRERLWTLMALDNMVTSRDRQLVDQDAHTGRWALCRPGRDSAIECSARGRIPGDAGTLEMRVEDELVRQALAQGCARSVLADVLGISERTTWHKERRAQAYDIPLEAVSRRAGSVQEAGPGVPSSGDD